MKIERIKELNDTLTKILADPQPGLFTWCEWLGRTMGALADEWNEPVKHVARVGGAE